MKYFLDSAKIDEIRYAHKNWKIDGVTTNPRHIMSSGKGFYEVLEELAAEFAGRRFPISVEINPHLDQAEPMVADAQKIAKLSKNFCIKIPCTEQGVIAAKELAELGIDTNVTLVFSATQAIQAARIGARYCSPFVGWKETHGEEGFGLIEKITKIYRTYNYKTEIIVAAVRNGAQIVQAAEIGADIVTAGYEVYKDSFYHPFTDYGTDIFTKAWDKTNTA